MKKRVFLNKFLSLKVLPKSISDTGNLSGPQEKIQISTLKLWKYYSEDAGFSAEGFSTLVRCRRTSIHERSELSSLLLSEITTSQNVLLPFLFSDANVCYVTPQSANLNNAVVKNQKLLSFTVLIIYRAVDPHLFFADPDPAVFLNADSIRIQLLFKCGPGSSLKKLCKNQP